MAEVESHDNDGRNRRTERQQLMRGLSGLAMSIEPYDPKKDQQESYCWGNFDFDCGCVKEYLEQTYGEVQDSLKPTLYEICQEAFKVIDEFLKWALNDEQGMAIFVQLEHRWDTVVRKFDMCMSSGGQQEKPVERGRKAEGSKIMVTARTSNENWEAIRGEYDISKKDFGKNINFVSDSFKKKVIFRDVEHAFVLASGGLPKPAVILAGGVIEELLKLYLEHKKIEPKSKRFADYIKACEDNDLLKRGVSRLTDSIRDFRNLVHLDNEKTKRHTISKATAKGAVSSIFTIANDFQ